MTPEVSKKGFSMVSDFGQPNKGDAASSPDERELVRFNFKKRQDGSGLSYLLDLSAVTKAEVDENKPEKKEEGGPEDSLKSVLNDFASRVMDSANIYRFLNRLNTDYVSKLLEDKLLPEIKASGKETAPADGFEAAYLIHMDVLAAQQEVFQDIRRSLKTRTSLGSMILLNMTAHYDVLVTDLIRLILKKFPGLMDKSEKTFTLSDLRRLGSIDDAERQLIDREIDGVMYGSHKSQLEWLQKHANKEILPYLRNIPYFCEIFERRNICAHSNQIVNDRYIANCLKYDFPEEKIQKKGDLLKIDSKYVSRASEILLEVGIISCQIIWRALHRKDKDEILEADRSLILHANRLSSSKKFELSSRLLELGYSKFNPSNDLNKRQMILNHAEALIEMDKLPEAQKIIKDQDWSSSNIRMRIFSGGVLCNHKEVVSLMKLAKSENSISPNIYFKSPAFYNIIKEETFLAEFLTLYAVSAEEFRKKDIMGQQSAIAISKEDSISSVDVDEKVSDQESTASPD